MSAASSASLVRRLAGPALIGVLLAVWVVVGGTRLTTDATTASLLPANDAAQKATNAAAQYFGGDPVVVLLESKNDGALLQSDALTALVRLEGSLSQISDVQVVYGPATVLNQVAASAQDLLASISGRRDLLISEATQQATAKGLKGNALKQAVAQAISSFDVRYGSLLVRGLPAGLPTLNNPAFVKSVVFDQDGNLRSEWRFVLPARNAVAILVRPRASLDQSHTERLVAQIKSTVHAAVGPKAIPASQVTISGLPTVAADLGQTVRREIPLIGALGLAVIGACYLFVPWVRPRRRRLLPLSATLIATAVTLAAFGWLGHPLSLGVVAFLPILVGTGSDFPAYLAWGANRRRVLVTALAAATGFFALGVSPVPFVRDLGLALGAGVLIACLSGVLLARGATSPDPTVPVATPAAPPSRARGPWLAALAAAIALAAVGWVALSGLRVDTQPEHLARGLSSLNDATHAEAVLGSAGEVEVFVTGNNVLTPSALGWMDQVQSSIVRRFGDQLRPVVSPPTLLAFLGPNPTADQISAGIAQLPDYLSRSVLRPDGKEAVLSFGIGLGDVAQQAKLLKQVQAALPRPPAGIHAELAGLPVVTARGYELAFGDRYVAGLAGVVGATLVLLVGLRRFQDAARAGAAALLATGWSFAGASLLHIALTPLTLTLGSLATATACEFSVLLADASLERRRGLLRSVLVAATAATGGYLALAISRLAVIRDFGLFLAVTVVLSLVAARLVLAAFPARPAPGKPRRIHKEVDDEDPSHARLVDEAPHHHGDRGGSLALGGRGSGSGVRTL